MKNVLFEQSNYPILQNRVYETSKDAINCSKGDIQIIEDSESGLIYNALFRQDLMNYDFHYNNEQGNSLFFQEHLNAVKEIIRRELGITNLVEVGCGKGFFFEMMLADGFDVYGFDPTYEGDNPRIVKEYFKTGIMKPSRGLILRHVLEHIPDPYNFLCNLRDANGGGGLIYIEVPCFDWICNNKSWVDIFYEHVNYFRMIDFFKMFGNIKSSGKLFGDQYLYVVVDLSTLKPPKYTKKDSIQFPKDFLNGIDFEDHDKNQNVVIWGGASKGVIFSLLRERIGKPVSAVVDINPSKQGKFLPVTGLKILSPETFISDYPKETILYVMNSNYLEEINKMTNSKFNLKVITND